MHRLLEHCRDWPLETIAPGTVLLRKGERSRRLYCLLEGALEVFHEDVQISINTEPGAIFGEMSLLLDMPHTASVRAIAPTKVYFIDDAPAFLEAHPQLMLPIATLLARRLRNATNYLVNLKQQFQDQANHLGMVDEVLESISHEQGETFPPALDLPPDP